MTKSIFDEIKKLQSNYEFQIAEESSCFEEQLPSDSDNKLDFTFDIAIFENIELTLETVDDVESQMNDSLKLSNFVNCEITTDLQSKNTDYSIPIPDINVFNNINKNTWNKSFNHNLLKRSLENCETNCSGTEPPLKKKKIEQIPIKKIEEQIIHDLRVNVTKKLYVKIDESEINVGGRPKIKGTSKQFCHVIPFSLIKEMLSSILNYSHKIPVITEKIIKLLSFAAKNIKGYALNMVEISNLKHLEDEDKALKLSDRQFIENEEIKLLYSPSKKLALYPNATTPSKRKEASTNFQKIFSKYISTSFKMLFDEIKNDHNTLFFTAQEISKFIITLFCTNKNAVFAPIGNTQRFEIRYYKNEADAYDNIENYEVITAHELKSMRIGSNNTQIRIANCEGSNLKKYIKSTTILKQILVQKNIENLIDIYNEKYNEKIKLANIKDDLDDYNLPIQLNDFITQVEYHIAKNLYLAFDLKVLENIVFIPQTKENFPSYSMNNIPITFKVLTSASGKIKKDYVLSDGAKYREQQIKKCDIKEKFLRNSEKDKKILPKKLAELFLISTVDFIINELSIGSIILSNILDNLTNLAAKDYQLDEFNTKIFKEQVTKNYESLIPEEINDFDNIEILGSIINDYSNDLSVLI